MVLFSLNKTKSTYCDFKMKRELFIAFSVCSIILCLNACEASIQKALQEHEIVPDVIATPVTKSIQVSRSFEIRNNATNKCTVIFT